MAFAATMATQPAFSIGPKKIQYFTYSVASGDTSGTITCTGLSNVELVVLDGACGVGTAAPTFSSNVATLAFANPLATRYGSGFAVGT